MKGKGKKEHRCELNEIEWSNEPLFDDGVSFKGKCPICGKEYESVYSYSGIWDTEGKEYVLVV